MVATYNLLGRQVGSHYMAMTVLGTMFLGSGYAMSGGEKKKAQGPPINATSKDEEAYIQEFLKSAEAEEKKEKK